MLFGRLVRDMSSRFLLIFLPLFFFSCGSDKEKSQTQVEVSTRKHVETPLFNGDSAYYFVEKQVHFGPRVPNTAAHQKASQFFINKFTQYGAVITLQEFQATTFDNTKVQLRNIIATFYPEARKRILLAAHWDTRPFADKDEENPNALFDGANDGASGVGILLEVARNLSHSNPGVGVDIILFDGEDWGEREYGHVRPPEGLKSWWCLGSQHWSITKHQPGYSAYYGILLDMVGAKNARFYREGLSLAYAPKVVEKVWNTAESLGYSHLFVKRNQTEITDDHKFVNEIAKIPMINIVNYDPATGWFGSFHHTRDDNLDLISKETLEAVGKTVLQVIFDEGAGI